VFSPHLRDFVHLSASEVQIELHYDLLSTIHLMQHYYR
jgi:hypothetical protein